MVEGAIRNVKRVLYYVLRSHKTHNWGRHLQTATNIVNNHYNTGIGGLQPSVCNKGIYNRLALIKGWTLDCLY